MTTELDADVFVSFDAGVEHAPLDVRGQAHAVVKRRLKVGTCWPSKARALTSRDFEGQEPPAPGEEQEELEAAMVARSTYVQGGLQVVLPDPAIVLEDLRLRKLRRERRAERRPLGDLRVALTVETSQGQRRPRERRASRTSSSTRASPSGDPDPEPDHVARPQLAGEARRFLKAELDRRARAALAVRAALDRDLFVEEVAPA